jgi:putative transposase
LQPSIGFFDPKSRVGFLGLSNEPAVAAAALEDALIKRRPKPGLKLRSDKGLIFGAEDFHKVARTAGIRQEYITPYTP